MDFTKRPIVVIYIDKNKALFYFENTKQTLQLDIPQSVISDLDLLSKEQLEQVINSFFQSNNLKEVKLDAIIVFSQTSAFEKDLAQELPQDKRETEIQKFIDIVPFEDVLSKTYVLNKKTKVVAINKSLFEAMLSIFKQKNIFIFSIVPFSVLQELNSELLHSVNLTYIASKANSFNQYSLISEGEEVSEGSTKKTSFIQKQNIRIYVLIGIFLTLLLVLVVLVITTFFPAGKPQKSQIILPTITPTKTPTVEEIFPTASPSGNIQSSESASTTPSIPVVSEPPF
ncbi:MAG: hypothetical protein A2171_01785 [Candidatus Levybacteria bacterium RBG_13_35_9]|nr:MAG: hypothetical protein A2171_01785 [Candidatus Levybacteria bacterium RBG_13_35_9]